MAITVADNFSYQGKKPLDGRDGFDTLAQMKAYPEASVYDGCLTYCKEDEKYYTFKASNTVDVTTGKWREFSGGGGQTYSDFTGATASTAGAHGLVPAPSAGDEGKVLFGSGLWGALPSVDLSVLSNEAFIFSETEKPVGMWIDRKLLYAKTVNCGSMPDHTVKTVAHGISNLGELVLLQGVCKYNNGSSYTFYPLPKIHDQDINLDIGLANDATNISLMGRGNGFPGYTGFVVLLYTKTTDSPLPSGVKFAGVTDTGDVIYKKWVTTGGAVPSGGTLLYRQALLNGKDIIYYTT